jgi:hypothetical protein
MTRVLALLLAVASFGSVAEARTLHNGVAIRHVARDGQPGFAVELTAFPLPHETIQVSILHGGNIDRLGSVTGAAARGAKRIFRTCFPRGVRKVFPARTYFGDDLFHPDKAVEILTNSETSGNAQMTRYLTLPHAP